MQRQEIQVRSLFEETTMSVSAISGNNLFGGYAASVIQNKFQKIQQDFQQLGQDLQAGNLSQAQNDFSTLEQCLSTQQQNGTANTPVGAKDASPVSQAISQLGQDLKAGNLSAAQSDFTRLQNDFQQPGGISSHRFHHRHHGGPIEEGQQSGSQNGPATLFGELGQELQSGNVTAAQQTYSALQQDFLQFASTGSSASSSATASTAGATSLNVSV
jgi:hypothetical protein